MKIMRVGDAFVNWDNIISCEVREAIHDGGIIAILEVESERVCKSFVVPDATASEVCAAIHHGLYNYATFDLLNIVKMAKEQRNED